MNRIEAKEFYPFLQAFVEGRVIECRTKGADTPNDWTEMKEIEFWKHIEYRIKPEPTYRPFVNAKECWQEMLKHQPVGFMKFKDTESGYYMLTSISRGVGVGINDSLFSYDRVFDDYTFADGTPFGVKVGGIVMFGFYFILITAVLSIAFMGGVIGYLIGKYWEKM